MTFTKRSGDTVEEDMTEVIAALRQGKWFYQEDAPAGEWTFSGTKGLSVTLTFDDAPVESAWVYAYPETLNEVEIELWAPRKALKPGEGMTVTRTLRIGPGPRGWSGLFVLGNDRIPVRRRRRGW